MEKLLIVTTVPETLEFILAGQPKYLSQYFDVSICSSDNKELYSVKDKEAVPVYPINMERRIAPIKDLLSIIRLVRLIRKLKPTIVHSYTPKAGLVAMAASYICGTPIRVHTFTGLLFPSKRGVIKLILKLVDKLICALATKIVPEGKGVKNELEMNQITTKELKVIGNGNIAGVDTEYFCRENPDVIAMANNLKRDLDVKGFVFIFVGRLNADKGLDILVEAFDSLYAEHCCLLIVGGLDESNPIDQLTLEKINFSERIKFLGFQKDIRPALFIADALILPSRREGFPNVLLQAGSMELPCISTNVNGADEIICQGDTGFIVPVENGEALTETMRQLIVQDPRDLELMGRAARTRMQELFERKTYQENLKKFYSDLLSGTRL